MSPTLGKEVSVNRDNNLEWVQHLGAGESKELEVKYHIEVPSKAEHKLEFKEY